MRIVVVVIMLFFGGVSFSQVYGDIGISKREVLEDCKREIMSSSKEGLIFLTIAVDVDGKVTSAELDFERSTVDHIILVREAKLRAQKMKFKSGIDYPKFHHGSVKFIVKKK